MRASAAEAGLFQAPPMREGVNAPCLQADKSRVFAKCCVISRSLCPVAATVRLGHLVFQTKRWNEAIRMADLKAQSP
jgi:hypothetical protein